jgi:hypothetical protein
MTKKPTPEAIIDGILTNHLDYYDDTMLHCREHIIKALNDMGYVIVERATLEAVALNQAYRNQ